MRGRGLQSRSLRTAEPGLRSGLQLRGAIGLYRARALRVGGRTGVDALDLSMRSDERSVAPGGAYALSVRMSVGRPGYRHPSAVCSAPPARRARIVSAVVANRLRTR